MSIAGSARCTQRWKLDAGVILSIFRNREARFAPMVAVGIVAILVGLPGGFGGHGPGHLFDLPGQRPSGHSVVRGAGASTSSLVSSVGGSGGALPAGTRPAPPVSSGRGTFFVSHTLYPMAQNQTCLTWGTTSACTNITNNPSLNLTSNGVLGVAYTAFVNKSACGNATNRTVTLIGFQSSRNFGTSWTAPQYLGNTNCSLARSYPSAEDPSLTSLPNGTLVLSYFEYQNYTTAAYRYYWSFPPYLYGEFVHLDRLVVRDSYDNGSHWSNPVVVDSSVNVQAGTFTGAGGNPPMRDSISARGNTVFLAYENLSYSDTYSAFAHYFSSQVHVAISLNGGQTFGPAVQLPVAGGHYFTTPIHYAVNPFVLAAPNGQVYVAYSTHWRFDGSIRYCTPYPPYNCQTNIFLNDIVVANSSDNGTTWATHIAAANQTTSVGYAGSLRPMGGFHDPSPVLAYGPSVRQLYLAYAGGILGELCSHFPPTVSCYPNSQAQDIFVQNSSTGGATWSAPRFIASLVDPRNGSANSAYNPAIAVSSTGVLQLVATFYNDTTCGPVTVGSACGSKTEVYLNSTDNGTTFSDPIQVTEAYSIQPDEYDGEYSSMLTWGTHFVFAWSDPMCAFSPCYYPSGSSAGTSDLVVSTPYLGPGVTVTFNETGLAPALHWSANLQGNVRWGPAGTNLTVSGVPTATLLVWNVPWINRSYGDSFASSFTPASPGTFAANSVVKETFAENLLYWVQTTPPFPTYGTPYPTNYNVTPTPGPYWVLPGTVEQVWANYTPITCTGYCYYSNLTFLSWTGLGVGASSTNASTTKVVVRHPINETANFVFNGQCNGNGAGNCSPLTGYALTFEENGLPKGTEWGVTLNGNQVVTAKTATITVAVNSAGTRYVVWTVPASGGQYWVASENYPSPLGLPAETSVNVTYRLQSPSSVEFPVNVSASGLPNGTSWAVETGNGNYSVGPSGTELTAGGGATWTVNGSFVYTTSGTGYYAANVSNRSFVVNASTWTFGGATPSAVQFFGPSDLVVGYRPMYALTMSASAGGSVTPASEWVAAGTNVTLKAVAAPGHHFLDWTGYGNGATSGAQNALPTVTITPQGPVTELATFLADPAPTWNITVIESGLPGTTPFTLTLGNTSYSGVGSFDIPRVASGPYALGTPDVYLPSNNSTRFAPFENASTFPTAGGQVTVTANGTIWVNFTEEFLLTLATDDGGNVTPSPGPHWEAAHAAVVLTALPDYHYRLVGWNGSGNGSAGGTAGTVQVVMDGPIWESAQFAWRVLPPANGFHLTVTETGLPPGVAWEVTVGVNGTSGSASTLTVGGLNGSYNLSVPPIYEGAGTRWVAAGGGPLQVTSNGTAAVTFTEQFRVTVGASTGGSVSSSSAWQTAGASLTLTATPLANWRFVGWNGSGPGSYTGGNPAATVTVNGPINESASFAPVVPVPKSSSASPTSEPLAIGLLVVALVVALAIAFLVGRRRSRPPAAPPPLTEEEPTTYDASDLPVEPEAGSTETYAVAPPEYSEDGLPVSPEPAPYDEGPPYAEGPP